jgi:hypothetical protein
VLDPPRAFVALGDHAGEPQQLELVARGRLG